MNEVVKAKLGKGKTLDIRKIPSYNLRHRQKGGRGDRKEKGGEMEGRKGVREEGREGGSEEESQLTGAQQRGLSKRPETDPRLWGCGCTLCHL